MHFLNQGSKWGFNGPLLTTRCARNLCPKFLELDKIRKSTNGIIFNISDTNTTTNAESATGVGCKESKIRKSTNGIIFNISDINTTTNAESATGVGCKERNLPAEGGVCHGMKVADVEAFLPVPLGKIETIFQPNSTSYLRKVKTETLFVYLYLFIVLF